MHSKAYEVRESCYLSCTEPNHDILCTYKVWFPRDKMLYCDRWLKSICLIDYRSIFTWRAQRHVKTDWWPMLLLLTISNRIYLSTEQEKLSHLYESWWHQDEKRLKQHSDHFASEQHAFNLCSCLKKSSCSEFCAATVTGRGMLLNWVLGCSERVIRHLPGCSHSLSAALETSSNNSSWWLKKSVENPSGQFHSTWWLCASILVEISLTTAPWHQQPHWLQRWSPKLVRSSSTSLLQSMMRITC